MFETFNRGIYRSNLRSFELVTEDKRFWCFREISQIITTLKEETLAEETFASGKIREIFGINFRELVVFCIFSEN